MLCYAFSDIYSTPRLAEPLENTSSFASGGGIIGLTNGSTSITGSVNANSVSQRHRVDALKTTAVSSSSVTQTIDSVSCDSRHRPGNYFMFSVWTLFVRLLQKSGNEIPSMKLSLEFLNSIQTK